MFRKLISLTAAAAIATAGLSAPARADGEDIAKIIAGIALLGIIAKAVEDDDRDVAPPPTRYPTYGYTPPRYAPPRYVPPRYIPPRHVPARPVPPRVTRYDLPGACLRSYEVNRKTIRLFGANCLRKNYAYASSLPYACQFQFSTRQGSHTGYEPLCLRERGYRVAGRH